MQDPMDASAALCAMTQATQRLDEILQLMCAAGDVVDDNDDAFADAREHATSSSSHAIDGVQDAQQQPQAVAYGSIKTSFSTIEMALAAAVDTKTAIQLTAQLIPADDSPDTEPKDEDIHLRERFASATRHMAFRFTGAVDDPSDCVSSLSDSEVSLHYDHFAARLREQLGAQDHLLPVAKLEAIGLEVIKAISAQNETTVHAIQSHFQSQEESDNQTRTQDQEIYWQQATSQVGQICISETQSGSQWGLQTIVTIGSLFRAQLSKQQQVDEEELLNGPVVSMSLQHRIFLAKSKYNSESPALSSTTTVYLMQQTQPASQPKTKSSSDPERATDPGTMSKSTSKSSQDRSFAVYPHDFPMRELPELLKIYVRGGFSDEVPSAEVIRQHQEFVRLTIQTPFPRMRIVQAASSRSHTLLLSDLGMVFAFGHSVDGALGLGFEGMGRMIESPRLVTFFFDKLITIRAIACGGDPMAGAHSAAVASDGSVYTWGTGIALGNRSVRSHAEPQLIQLPAIEGKTVAIQSVACGGGFCIALAESGHAFAWGKWSDGRLGLGKIPILHQSSRKFGRRRQFQSFQLSPKLLACDTSQIGNSSSSSTEVWRFVKVSCGEAHSIGLTLHGEIVTWGRGTHGQLSLGTTRDALQPAMVVVASDRCLKWRDVAAGENWSMALDEHGRVWAWGACGGAVLGQGSGSSPRKTSVVTEMILQRHHRLLKQQTSAGTAPPLPHLNWMRPQLVPCFGNGGGVRIQRLSAGLQHAAAISSDGDLYLWGDGHGFSPLPSLLRSAGTNEKSGLGSEIVEHVVCGGDLVIVFTSGSFLARSMQQLYRQCALLSDEHQDLDPSALYQVTRHLATDIALLVSGKRLFAHKLLLARRSAVLKALILNEQRGSSFITSPQKQEDDTEVAIIELLLPQLHFDVAQVLLEFIYTDNFSLRLDPQSYLIRDVLRAAQFYQLLSLEKLCRKALVDALSLSRSAAVFPLDGIGSGSEFADQDEERSLNMDLQFAFGDRTWSDLTLVAEGDKEIPVHRCVLVARSEYFRALLGFQLNQNGLDSGNIVVQVDESYAAMLRVLKYIYNDHVELSTSRDNNQQPHEGDGEDEKLLEDLIAADKFGLVRWKRLCEHAVVVTLANCLEVLAVADLVSTSHLKQAALTFLQSNLQILMAEPAFKSFKDDFPHLLEELYTNIRLETSNEALLRNWHEAVETQVNLQREEEEREWKIKSDQALVFPWLHLILAVTFATLYLFVMSKQVHEYPFVPALNLVALLGFISALFFGWI